MFPIVLVSAAKRGMDIGIATVGLVLAVPIVAIAAVAIKLTSRGPVMHYQQRVGRHGRMFTVHKLRSMQTDAEALTGPVWASKTGAPRVTPIGRFLRRSRLDRYGIPVSGRSPYTISREGGVLVEVPGSTTRLGPVNLPVARGCYFRLLPYAWTRWGISRLNRQERRPAVFYLHPWEIDPDQPRLAGGRLGRFRHYRNFECIEEWLRRLLTDLKFGPIRDLVAAYQSQFNAAPATAPLPYVW